MIRVEDLEKRYGQRVALKGISFDLPAGSRTLLSGPSGSGKTTLLRLLAGLETPDGGRVWLDGREVSGPGTHVLPWDRKVGMAFQRPALWPHMTAAGNAGFGLLRWGWRERAARVSDLLAKLGAADLAGRRPGALSGGEAQRVALARALAPRPPLLLLDEPFSNLDPESRRALAGAVLAELSSWGGTLLAASHDRDGLDPLFEGELRLAGGRLLSVDGLPPVTEGAP